MQTMTLITGNTAKADEIKRYLGEINVIDIDLPEIQEINPEKVITAKLLEAHKHTPRSYIVEDTSLVIAGLNGLPGPLIKWFQQSLGNSGIYNMAKKCTDQNATARTTVGYISESGKISFHTGEISGKIVAERGDGGFGWDAIFQPDGDSKTFAEMTASEKDKYSMRKIACQKLLKSIN